MGPKIPQIPQNLFGQSAQLAQKFGISLEKKASLGVLLRAFCHQHSKLRTVLLSDTDKGPQRQNTTAPRLAGQILTEIMANLHHKLPFIERYSRPEAGFLPFLTMLGAHKGSLRSFSSSRVRCVL